MSYSEEQQRAYADVQYRLIEFDKLKAEIKTIKCAIHQKKCKVNASWTEDYEIHGFIEKYCCTEFAIQIVALFESKEILDAISIVPTQLLDNINAEISQLISINEYADLVKQYNFDEFPYGIHGGEMKMASFVPIDQADLDLRIHLCKVVLKRCFSATSGDLVFPWDYHWFIKHFFSVYKDDLLKPGLSSAIREAYEMLLEDKIYTKGIIATTFLFGVVEFYIKYELGFRPYDFDFFDTKKKNYYKKHFTGKKKSPPELSLGKGIDLLLQTDTEISRALKELDQHNLQRLAERDIDLKRRWIYPELSKRLTLYRNAMLHGELHSFYSAGHYLLMLYCLLHLYRTKAIRDTPI